MMNKVTCGISMSLDGFVAGPDMSEDKPLGDIPDRLLHRWMFEEPEKHEAEIAELTAAGAYVMGRNMYGPAGRDYDETWRGWWGDEPPYHAPVFVLTHRPRAPIQMEGGTKFIFVTDGIVAALRQAQSAAGDKQVAISGGASVVNQYLAAGLIDELWLHIVPVTIGKGRRLFDDIPGLRMDLVSLGGTQLVTHLKYRLIRRDR